MRKHYHKTESCAIGKAAIKSTPCWRVVLIGFLPRFSRIHHLHRVEGSACGTRSRQWNRPHIVSRRWERRRIPASDFHRPCVLASTLIGPDSQRLGLHTPQEEPARNAPKPYLVALSEILMGRSPCSNRASLVALMVLVEAMNRRDIRKHAERVFELSMKRAGHRCPKWARTPHFRAQFLKIYYKAARYNLTGFRRRQNGCGWHVDHIEPLKGKNVCGLHVPWNLHVIPSVINQAKGTLLVPEWHKRPSDVEHTRTLEEKRERRNRHHEERALRARALHNPTWDHLF